MTHRFPIKEIAFQSGLSTATVDRVLNNRSGVRRQTVNRVHTALRELEAQEAQLAMSGRKLMIDVLVEAPQSFLDALQEALRHELPLIQSAIFRLRSDLRSRFPVAAVAEAISRAERLGSDGVILMAPDAVPVRKAVDRLVSVGIPVVTLATDMPVTARAGYVGLDNQRAGETAAWLIRKWATSDSAPHVVVSLRNEHFRGEADRQKGFRAGLAKYWPGAKVSLIVQGDQGSAFAERVAEALLHGPAHAIYSIGGSNRAILNAVAKAGLKRPVIIGHDLDPENQALLAEGKIDAVLYHDLAEDIRHACQTFMSIHSRGAIPMPAQGAVLRVMMPPMLPPLEDSGK